MKGADPAYRGPTIPGYVKVSNHFHATSEQEAIRMGATFLDVPEAECIALRFQPTGSTLWVWASYALEKHSGKVLEKEEFLSFLLEKLTEIADDDARVDR